MAHIIFDDKRIELDQGQTVLSALLDSGYDIPNSCRAGACQSCMMQAVDGNIPDSAQQGLKDTQKAQGYFLACSCTPDESLTIAAHDQSSLRIPATVIEHTIVSNDILQLRLKTEQDFTYRAGQFINIFKDKLSRSYSLASVAELGELLELHIRRIDSGIVSNWLHHEIKPGNKLEIQQATGNCFYTSESSKEKILLAGTGTGLAPLIGIARDALQQNHVGEIHLVHGAKQVDDLYMHQSLINMSQQFDNFYYHASVLQADEVIDPITTESIDKLVLNIATEPSEWKHYLCGDENIVNTLKKKLFLAGASMSNIFTDPFIKSSD